MQTSLYWAFLTKDWKISFLNGTSFFPEQIHCIFTYKKGLNRAYFSNNWDLKIGMTGVLSLFKEITIEGLHRLKSVVLLMKTI